MRCSICDSMMSHSGICPKCGDEAARSKVSLEENGLESVDYNWVTNMEKAKMIANICIIISVGLALIGAYQKIMVKNETLGMALIIAGGVIFVAQEIFAEIVNRCPSCKRRFGFGGKYHNKWKHYYNCPGCHRLLYGYGADEDGMKNW